MKSIKKIPKKKIFIGSCIFLLAIVLCFFVYTGRDYGNQAMNALYLSAEFQGEYKVAYDEWQPYVKGQHIPADKGDVTLKGNFQLYVPTTREVVENHPKVPSLRFTLTISAVKFQKAEKNSALLMQSLTLQTKICAVKCISDMYVKAQMKLQSS